MKFFGYLLATAAFAGAALAINTTAKAEHHAVVPAKFNTDGSVKVPEGFRKWIFVGSPLTPNGLNGGQAAFPEFHNVYIEPSAFEHYSKTGEFADGTQIVKELVSVRESEEGNYEDGSADASSGRGYWNGDFQGLELLYKDKKRFEDAPGGWVFYNFGHHTPPYETSGTPLPVEMCSACHEANGGTDYVFTQFYPLLRQGE